MQASKLVLIVNSRPTVGLLYSHQPSYSIDAMRNSSLRASPVRLPFCCSFAKKCFHDVRPASHSTSYTGTNLTTTNGLVPPEILHSSNHLLAVNKPPGWHSIPNVLPHDRECKPPQLNPADSKCLLTYLALKRLGGGSTKVFLKPLHRLDQPCTGVLLLGKTTKAASRIQGKWDTIDKTYLVVAQASTIRGEALLEQQIDSGVAWSKLCAHVLVRRKAKNGGKPMSRNHTDKGWSVTMIPLKNDVDKDAMKSDRRYVELEWKAINNKGRSNLLLVRTKQGTRHMVRSLLSSHGLVVRGDLRYGASTPLPDRSVALHARTLELPETLVLGHDLQRNFLAPIPTSWSEFFGYTEDDLKGI